MKKVLTILSTLGLIVALGTGVTMAATTTDSATAIGSLTITDTTTAARPSDAYARLYLDEFDQGTWTKSDLSLNHLVFNRDVSVESMVIDVKDFAQTTNANEEASPFKVNVYDYLVWQGSIPSDTSVNVTIQAKYDHLADPEKIYDGPLSNLTSTNFWVYPTLVDEEGNVLSEPMTRLYFKFDVDANGSDDARISYKLAITAQE